MNQLPTTKRILAFESQAFLSLQSKRIRIRRKEQIDVFVPVEDVGVIILESMEVAVTTALLAALVQAEVSLILCNEKHLPVATYMPFDSHHQHARILAGQIEASQPTKKRIWQQIVRSKVNNQADLLSRSSGSSAIVRVSNAIRAKAKEVKSGDTTNVEGVAAAWYFNAAFGTSFTRNSDNSDLTNGMLNYGYALIRAATCRAICAAGLHPALGVFHHNRYNPYALADDMMEPLRPIVDECVMGIQFGDETDLTPAIKHQLHPVLTATVVINGERLPLMPALERYAANMRRCLLAESNRLECPIDLSFHGSHTSQQLRDAK